MKTLKFITIIVLLVGFVFSVRGQDSESKLDKEQKIKSQKIAFFTNKIGLTPEEAQIFWPVYNNYWAKKNKIISTRKENMTYFSENIENMSNDEMIRYADQYIGFEMALAELLDEYHVKFKEILPIDKVMKIYLADYEFKTYLLKKISEGGNHKKEE
ncbi:MAG: hypothetical protein PF485_12585 [Bacteroidales bacterium]|jgi:hypothetical protein|nr:hypothetical protein [Bacteroidales bacterium]